MKEEKKEQMEKILKEKVDELMNLRYEDLLRLVDKEPEHITYGIPENEDFYQIEIDVFFDDEKQKNIRVLGTIDNGGMSAFFPLNYGFIMTSEGKIL